MKKVWIKIWDTTAPANPVDRGTGEGPEGFRGHLKTTGVIPCITPIAANAIGDALTRTITAGEEGFFGAPRSHGRSRAWVKLKVTRQEKEGDR